MAIGVMLLGAGCGLPPAPQGTVNASGRRTLFEKWCHFGNAGTGPGTTDSRWEIVDINTTAVKNAAKVLRDEVRAAGAELTHSQSLEIVAHQLGYRDWNTASAQLSTGSGAAIPVLRVQDGISALQFYVGYLGFAVDWEHRFEEGMPLYARISRSQTTLDLSEHYGDGTPGSVIWIPVSDLRSLHRELKRRPNRMLRPNIESDAPGGPTMTITDPFGNELRFCEPTPQH